MAEETTQQKQRDPIKDIAIVAEGETISFQPRNFEELWRFAQLIASTDMVPSEYKGNAGKILAAVQFGHEVGLKPMQALQTIAVINGRPTIWGDGALALVKSHPACGSVVELPPDQAEKQGYGECTIKRRDQGEPITRRFTRDMAKKAGLYQRSGEKGPWANYEGRMLQMRARAWCMRDAIPEALKGMPIREEAYDIEAETTTDTSEEIPAPRRASEQQAETHEEKVPNGSAEHPTEDGKLAL